MIAHRSFIPLWIFLALAAPVCLPIKAAAVTVEQIPSPRPAGWVVDLTGTLPSSTVADLNRLGDDVKARTGAELAVVVIPTTGGTDPHDFATRLFNTWGIGEAGKDNGVLVFAALDDRAAEIILGNGVDDDARVRKSESIMQRQMVPRFRAGDAAGALWHGAQACANWILVPESQPDVAAPPSPSPQGLYRPRTLPGPVKRGSPAGYGPLFFILALFSAIGGGIWLFNRPPSCPRCKEAMTLLDEAADDAYLQPSEQLEERIGSVDHQVWTCAVCGEQSRQRRVRFFSGYGDCPQCSSRALKSTTTTLSAATYDHGGLVQIHEECANCSHRNSFTRSTPRMSRPSSRSSFSSSGSRSSGFGGGRSSGRGSSGRW